MRRASFLLVAAALMATAAMFSVSVEAAGITTISIYHYRGLTVVEVNGSVAYYGGDTDAIQYAFDVATDSAYSYIVFTPDVYRLRNTGTTPGLYKYAYSVQLKASNVYVDARGAFFILLDEASLVIGSDVIGERYSNITWYGGVFITPWNVTFTKSHGVVIVFQSSQVTLEEVTIKQSPYHGFHVLMGSKRVVIRECHIEDVGGQAIALDGSDHSIVIDNTVYNATVGINMQVNSDYEAQGYDGVPEFNSIIGNTVEDVKTGIAVMGGRSNTITGNAILVNISRAAETYGIAVLAYRAAAGVWVPSHNSVIGNTIAGARYAIALSGYPDVGNTTYNIIQGNTVRDSYYYVLVKYAENNTIGPNPATTRYGVLIGPEGSYNYIANWNPFDTYGDIALSSAEGNATTGSGSTNTSGGVALLVPAEIESMQKASLKDGLAATILSVFAAAPVVLKKHVTLFRAPAARILWAALVLGVSLAIMVGRARIPVDAHLVQTSNTTKVEIVYKDNPFRVVYIAPIGVSLAVVVAEGFSAMFEATRRLYTPGRW